MPTKIVVPELGESVLEATVGRWLKQEGDRVSVGDAIVELETDKVNLEVGAEQAGVLASIERQEGEDVQIGDVLGVIEEAPEEKEAPSEGEDRDRDRDRDREEGEEGVEVEAEEAKEAAKAEKEPQETEGEVPEKEKEEPAKIE